MPQDRPKTAPRGSWRALFSLLKTVLNLDSFWIPFWDDFGVLFGTLQVSPVASFSLLKFAFFWHVIWVTFWSPQRRPKRRPRGPKRPQDPPKTAQEAPKRPQDPPKSAPRRPQERPRRLQEGPEAPQEPVKRTQNPPKSSQEPPKTPTRLFRSTWLGSRFRKILKKSKHGSKRHRRSLRSPISMNPKGLASHRRMKKGGRAAVIPLGEVSKTN